MRILGNDGVTSLPYVKKGAHSKASSLINPTQDKIAILATFWLNYNHIWPNCLSAFSYSDDVHLCLKGTESHNIGCIYNI